MMSWSLRSQAGLEGEELNFKLHRKRFVILIPAEKIMGKSRHKRLEKRKNDWLTGSANFFAMVRISKLLFLTYSCLRLVNALTNILWAAGGCTQLNMLKPKNGFATNSKTANERYILADLNLYMFLKLQLIYIGAITMQISLSPIDYICSNVIIAKVRYRYWEMQWIILSLSLNRYKYSSGRMLIFFYSE